MDNHKSQNIFLAVTCLAIFFIISLLSNNIFTFKRKHINSDVVQYYSFVTATFECKDLSYKNNCPENHESLPINNGRFVNKRSVGMAYMYTPFYGVAKLISKIQGKTFSGYSKSTEKVLVIGIWIYLCVGLFFLGKALFRFFSYPIVLFSLFTLVLSTNLIWYIIGEALFTHSVNFMWMSILIYATIQFHDTKKGWWLLAVSLAVSMLTVIRPNNILFGLIFILYGVYDKNSLNIKWNLLLSSLKYILLAVLVFLIPLIPQFFYWKFATGQWVYYSYTGEKFFWSRPLIAEVLFSYRKGWWLYTPFMLLIIPGFFIIRKKVPEMFLPTIIIFPLFVYITSCWWAWSYGGSFGMRPMVDLYPLLIFSIAGILKSTKWYKWVPILFFTIGCTHLNIFQAWQFNIGVLHWDHMNKKTYWAIWEKTKWPLEYDLLVSYPDYSKERTGKGSYYTTQELTDGEYEMKFIRTKNIAPEDSVSHILSSHGNNMPYPNSFTFRFNSYASGFTIFSTATKTYWKINEDGFIYSNEEDILLASIFKIESLGHNKFALKASNGKYVQTERQEGFRLSPTADSTNENTYIVIQRYFP